MVQTPILFVPYYKNICKHNVFCNLRMCILAVGINLTESFTVATEQLVCNDNILAKE